MDHELVCVSCEAIGRPISTLSALGELAYVPGYDYEFLAKCPDVGLFSLHVIAADEVSARDVVNLYIDKWGFDTLHAVALACVKRHRVRRVFDARSNYTLVRKRKTANV